MKLHIKSKYRIETGSRWKMKTPKFSRILIGFAQLWGLLDNFEKFKKNENYPFSIYGFYDFFLLKNIKSTKNP